MIFLNNDTMTIQYELNLFLEQDLSGSKNISVHVLEKLWHTEPESYIRTAHHLPMILRTSLV